MTTMASSTSIPSTSTMANRVLPLMVFPVSSMKRNVVARATGMPMAANRAWRVPRNTARATKTRAMPIQALDLRVDSTSLMYFEESLVKTMSIPSGSRSRS